MATNASQFLAFHARYPEVYEALVDLAFERYDAGHEKCGMRLLYEVARWRLSLRVQGGTYKLNSDYVPYYSRLIMADHPELQGFFTLRESEADYGDWLERALGRMPKANAS